MAKLGDWVEPHPHGLYVKPANLWVDPARPSPVALVTHGHADHARGGHEAVWATPETLAIMETRYGPQAGHPIAYGQSQSFGDVTATFVPAGHVLGSAQILLEYRGERIVVSGDYKRRADPTCAPFEPVQCDVFITEATFGLPVFRHPDTGDEIDKLTNALHANPARCVLVGAYALGKAQRVLAELLPLDDRPAWLHGAIANGVAVYRQAGVPMLETLAVAEQGRQPDAAGQLILAPPSAAGTPWMRRFGRHQLGFASGWMQLRGNRRRRNVDRGFVISDHADWPALLQTIEQTGAQRVIATHGNTDALIPFLRERGVAAEAFRTDFGSEE